MLLLYSKFIHGNSSALLKTFAYFSTKLHRVSKFRFGKCEYLFSSGSLVVIWRFCYYSVISVSFAVLLDSQIFSGYRTWVWNMKAISWMPTSDIFQFSIKYINTYFDYIWVFGYLEFNIPEYFPRFDKHGRHLCSKGCEIIFQFICSIIYIFLLIFCQKRNWFCYSGRLWRALKAFHKFEHFYIYYVLWDLCKNYRKFRIILK